MVFSTTGRPGRVRGGVPGRGPGRGEGEGPDGASFAIDVEELVAVERREQDGNSGKIKKFGLQGKFEARLKASRSSYYS